MTETKEPFETFSDAVASRESPPEHEQSASQEDARQLSNSMRMLADKIDNAARADRLDKTTFRLLSNGFAEVEHDAGSRLGT